MYAIEKIHFVLIIQHIGVKNTPPSKINLVTKLQKSPGGLHL